jgi:4-hydroxyphenylpyruvate dioxygenase-like putative hemolysin
VSWLERGWIALSGLTTSKIAFVFMGAPDGQASIELIKYYTPSDEKGIQQTSANTLGIRHIALAVEDIDAVVAKLRAKGAQFIGEMQNYEDSFKLCYVRGPEGIIVGLAEPVK